MSELYALPDHEVVEDLIPGISGNVIDKQEALARIHSAAGMVPLAIDPETEGEGRGKVLWGDLGEHPFLEWQYTYTLQSLAREGSIGDSFATDISILLDDEVLTDPIAPSGFIFHTSRCGSTLTAKALARSPRNIVINQGAPLQRGFWAAITRDWKIEAAPTQANLKMFRNLVLAMTRRRRPEQDRSFVKFISWNTLYLDFVRAAFPETPALFLYRDPVEIVASILDETTAVLWAKGKRQAGFLTGLDWQETAGMSDVEYLAHCFSRYLRTADAATGKIAHANYRDINPATFPGMLEHGLQFDPGAEELALMLEQFQYYSKDDSDQLRFRPDSVKKRASISDADKALIDSLCGEFVDRLDRNPANLFAGLAN